MTPKQESFSGSVTYAATLALAEGSCTKQQNVFVFVNVKIYKVQRDVHGDQRLTCICNDVVDTDLYRSPSHAGNYDSAGRPGNCPKSFIVEEEEKDSRLSCVRKLKLCGDPI